MVKEYKCEMTGTVIAAIISCLVSFFLGGALAFLASKMKGVFKREKALADGLQSLLRSQLIDYHDKYVQRGYCPVYVKEVVTHNYEAYHELGGNGVITGLYEEVMKLPVKPPEKKEEGDTKHGDMD